MVFPSPLNTVKTDDDRCVYGWSVPVGGVDGGHVYLWGC